MRRLQIKFPSQIRISGWDFGSSARAMNQAGGKDSLMTYESVPFTQADLRTVRKSTTERKKMSTKTSIKRIALVAVSALGFGVLTSVAPATAAATIAYTTMQDTTNGKQIVGGLATVTITPDASTNYRVQISGGTTTKWDLTDADSDSSINGVAGAATVELTGNYSDVQYVATDAVDTVAVQLTRDTVGDVVVTVTPYNASGVLGTAVTKTVGFIAASSLDLASIQFSTLPGNDAANCTVANKANAAHNSITVQDSDDTANATATDIDLCVIALNGLGTAKTGVNITITSNGKGLVGGTAVTTSAADADGLFQADVTGNGLSGEGIFTATVTSTNADATTTTKTATVSIKFYGELAKLTLTNKKWSLDDGDGATNAFSVGAFDENGFAMPLDLTGSQELILDSDISTTATIDDPNETDAQAVFAIANDGSISALGVSTDAVINMDPAATKFEKIAVTVRVTNSDGVKITSNSSYIYTSDAASLTPVVTVTAGESGASQTVSAKVLADITGKSYPVADGETVTFATSGGALSASTATTSDGVASVTLYNSAISGDYTLTATADTLIGSSKYSVSGGIGDTVTSAVDAANEATDAANAATDAANAAAEAADAATAAAQDAQAAVAALATQVASLIAGIKAQITTLTNLVIKIQKKVKA